jgi:hypothetical protein
MNRGSTAATAQSRSPLRFPDCLRTAPRLEPAPPSAGRHANGRSTCIAKWSAHWSCRGLSHRPRQRFRTRFWRTSGATYSLISTTARAGRQKLRQKPEARLARCECRQQTAAPRPMKAPSERAHLAQDWRRRRGHLPRGPWRAAPIATQAVSNIGLEAPFLHENDKKSCCTSAGSCCEGA